MPVAQIPDVSLVGTALARSFGIGATVIIAGRDALIATIRDRQMLLVPDNFEHFLDAAPLLTDLLAACPRLKILVTSRPLLQVGGEHVFPVPPLAMPDPHRETTGEDIIQSATIQLFAIRAEAIAPLFQLS